MSAVAGEWSAETVDQSEAEAGAATTRRAWTAERVRQAVAAGITASGSAIVSAINSALGGTSWQGGGGSGTKTLAVLTPMTSQPPATAFATLDTRNSIAVLDFDAAADESATWVFIVPEGANLASGLSVRITWTATSATSGNCRWRVALENLIGSDIDADSFGTAAEATGAANGTSGIPTVTTIAITTIDSLAAGDTGRLRVTRVGTDAGNDTMTGDAELISVEIRGVA